MLKRGRNGAIAAMLALSLASWAPIGVLACTTAGTGGVGAASTGGGGFSNPFGPLSATDATYVVAAGLTLLVGLAVMSVFVAVVVTRRKRHAVPASRFSPDGRYWWDGAFWRPLPPR